MNRTLTFSIDLPADYEGALIHATTVLGVGEHAIASDALIYALRRVHSNMLLSGSMLGSLEESEANAAVLRTRIARAMLVAEKALADNTTLVRTISSMLATEPPKPQTPSAEPRRV